MSSLAFGHGTHHPTRERGVRLSTLTRDRRTPEARWKVRDGHTRNAGDPASQSKHGTPTHPGGCEVERDAGQPHENLHACDGPLIAKSWRCGPPRHHTLARSDMLSAACDLGRLGGSPRPTAQESIHGGEPDVRRTGKSNPQPGSSSSPSFGSATVSAGPRNSSSTVVAYAPGGSENATRTPSGSAWTSTLCG